MLVHLAQQYISDLETPDKTCQHIPRILDVYSLHNPTRLLILDLLTTVMVNEIDGGINDIVQRYTTMP